MSPKPSTMARSQPLPRRALLSLAAAMLSVGCASEPVRVVTAKLEISDAGVYMLDGVVVAKENLTAAVRAKHPKYGRLLLHILPTAKTSYEDVSSAMQAAQSAGAQVGMVGNERF